MIVTKNLSKYDMNYMYIAGKRSYSWPTGGLKHWGEKASAWQLALHLFNTLESSRFLDPTEVSFGACAKVPWEDYSHFCGWKEIYNLDAFQTSTSFTSPVFLVCVRHWNKVVYGWRWSRERWERTWRFTSTEDHIHHSTADGIIYYDEIHI